MASTIRNFDFSEAIGELTSFARERINYVRGKSASDIPDPQQVKIAVLSAVSSERKNTHQIQQTIAVSSAGIWNPTSGELQVAITELQGESMLSSTTEGERKVYLATKKGRKALEEALSEKLAGPDDSGSATKVNSGTWKLCDPQFLLSASKLGPVLLDIGQTGTARQQQLAAEALNRMRNELHGILADTE